MRMLPNLLSLGRILCGPLVMLLIAEGGTAALLATILVMLVAEVSDLLDGHMARKLGVASPFGKIVDPLADSLYRALVFLTFLDAGWMPMWMVAVIISRDILVSYLRIFSEQNGVTMGARQSGKIKAVFQGVVQIGTVALVLASGGVLAGAYATLVFSLLLVATVVTAWSGIDYTMGFLRTVDLRHMVANRG
ncbi:MAG: CDP-diacylglycerol--glycerol-3-phosphate 3-phosphatidyltransferase [Geminicoccaceae bacterium]|nr:CDP-diacylglycerol--glycerol-3-phosphate 3-phosphatidyltransferase [Geminicoccaceae bacterium]